MEETALHSTRAYDLSGRWQIREHLRNPRFWAVQGLVILATAVHWSFELLRGQTDAEIDGLFVVIMYAVYFVPVIYASLNFGREGAIPTAIWVAILGIPSILLWHSGVHRLVDGAQHLTIIGLAVVIASRVDREVSARREAERESRARRLSEARYRSLFNAAGDAILVFDERGVVREANATAVARFGLAPKDCNGAPLSKLLGDRNAERLSGPARRGERCDEDIVVETAAGYVWLEPICNQVRSNGDPPLTQVVLRDVTAERERRQGLERYARQILQAQEEERRRIARELHDSPLQSLILLHRELDALEVGNSELSDEVRNELAEIRRQAVDIADELRRYSRDLRPSILDDLGLLPAVRWLVTDIADRTGIQTDLEVVGDLQRLPPELELGLFRIAQEALRNVERHAQASSVSVILTYREAQIALCIVDDGVGIDRRGDEIQISAENEHLGLLGMRERARLLGGQLTIQPVASGGTRVEATLPTPLS